MRVYLEALLEPDRNPFNCYHNRHLNLLEINHTRNEKNNLRNCHNRYYFQQIMHICKNSKARKKKHTQTNIKYN